MADMDAIRKMVGTDQGMKAQPPRDDNRDDERMAHFQQGLIDFLGDAYAPFEFTFSWGRQNYQAWIPHARAELTMEDGSPVHLIVSGGTEGHQYDILLSSRLMMTPTSISSKEEFLKELQGWV
jgi:hypothetical protein